jgi:LCP family protein required for cell wall assembly
MDATDTVIRPDRTWPEAATVGKTAHSVHSRRLAPRTSLRSFFARFAIAIVVVVVTAGGAVAFGNGRWERGFKKIKVTKVDKRVLTLPDAGEPANFLIIGTDSRAFVDNSAAAQAFGSADEVGGQRSDAIMVVHIEPKAHAGFVVSFPRDLWVDIPGHGQGRINSALGLGDATLIIQTINQNFHIPIAHYLEVDFAGFEKIVNTIGHVKIWFPTPARDGEMQHGKFVTISGLDQPEAGCRSLDGSQALAYVRSRHYQWYDAQTGKWRNDPRSDLSRIERQQYFVRSLAQTALDRGARNLTTAFALIDSFSSALKRDPNLKMSDLKALINAFRDVNPADIDMTTVPVVGAMHGRAQVLDLLQPDANAVLSRLWEGGLPPGLPSMAQPAETRVHVSNGSGVRGRGAEVNGLFAARGFKMVGQPDDADRENYDRTQVLWKPGHGGEGLAVVTALGSPAASEAQVGDDLRGADVLVIVGRDWDQLEGPIKQTSPGTTNATTTTRHRTTTSAPASTTSNAPTTTTTIKPPSPQNTAVVPVDPKTGGTLVGCP